LSCAISDRCLYLDGIRRSLFRLATSPDSQASLNQGLIDLEMKLKPVNMFAVAKCLHIARIRCRQMNDFRRNHEQHFSIALASCSNYSGIDMHLVQFR
jgi:hypothetical protein